MTWGDRAAVQFAETVIDCRGDDLVVLFQKHKVPIALDANVGKLDPLVVGEAHLLEVLDEAVVVRNVRTGLACNHDIGHFAELGELVDGAGLKNAGTLGQVVWSNLSSRDGRAVRYRRIELKRCVCETTRPSSGTTDSGNGVVSDKRSEWNVARLNVNVGAQQLRACI